MYLQPGWQHFQIFEGRGGWVLNNIFCFIFLPGFEVLGVGISSGTIGDVGDCGWIVVDVDCLLVGEISEGGSGSLSHLKKAAGARWFLLRILTLLRHVANLKPSKICYRLFDFSNLSCRFEQVISVFRF